MAQVSDHKLYHSVYSENPEAFTMSILRSSRYNPGSVYNTRQDDAWDHRASIDQPAYGVGADGEPEHEYPRDPPQSVEPGYGGMDWPGNRQSHASYASGAGEYAGGGTQEMQMHQRGNSETPLRPSESGRFSDAARDSGRYSDAFDEDGAGGGYHGQAYPQDKYGYGYPQGPPR